MTQTPKILVAVLALPLVLLFGVSYTTEAGENEALAIEFAMEKPFYVPVSSGSEKAKYVVIRVPADKQAIPGKDTVSAIKLEPKMEGDRVRLTVYALSGDANHIITCRDWEALHSDFVVSYLARLDETVQLVKLKDYGVGVGDAPLTFRVVPRRVLSPIPQDALATGCGCASCDGLICCPNPGYCLTCGACGAVCCKG